jgi:hypothetical protein
MIPQASRTARIPTPSHSQYPIRRPNDRRPAKLAELAERARSTNGRWDPKLGIKHWVRIAGVHRDNGYNLMAMDKVPSHRDYHTMLNSNLRKNVGIVSDICIGLLCVVCLGLHQCLLSPY